MATLNHIVSLEEEIAPELPELEDKRIPMNIKQQVLHAIANIEYGSVEVIIHDNEVVQIESRKKIRVDRSASARKNATS